MKELISLFPQYFVIRPKPQPSWMIPHNQCQRCHDCWARNMRLVTGSLSFGLLCSCLLIGIRYMKNMPTVCFTVIIFFINWGIRNIWIILIKLRSFTCLLFHPFLQVINHYVQKNKRKRQYIFIVISSQISITYPIFNNTSNLCKTWKMFITINNFKALLFKSMYWLLKNAASSLYMRSWACPALGWVFLYDSCWR